MENKFLMSIIYEIKATNLIEKVRIDQQKKVLSLSLAKYSPDLTPSYSAKSVFEVHFRKKMCVRGQLNLSNLRIIGNDKIKTIYHHDGYFIFFENGEL